MMGLQIAAFTCLIGLLSMTDARLSMLDSTYMDSFDVCNSNSFYNRKYVANKVVDAPSKGSSSSGIVKPSFGFGYPLNMDCTLILDPPPNHGIILSIRSWDLRPNSQDKITLSYTKDDYRPRQAIFSNDKAFQNKVSDKYENEYFESIGKMAIKFESGPGPTIGYDGFEIIYTVVSKSLPCKSYEFRCRNPVCISKELTCDDHNHCGDRSDQANCSGHITLGRKIGIICGVLFLIIAVICGVFIFLRRFRGNTVTTQTRIIASPPPYPYTQPAVLTPPQPYQTPPHPDYRC